MFNFACELSQPMDKTEFSSTAKNKSNCLIGKKTNSQMVSILEKVTENNGGVRVSLYY